MKRNNCFIKNRSSIKLEILTLNSNLRKVLTSMKLIN